MSDLQDVGADPPVVLRGGLVLTVDDAQQVVGWATRGGAKALGRDASLEVDTTVEHLRATLGEEAWAKGMNPDVPETTVLDNPYTYTSHHSASTHGR
jgi:hypothetical protein